MSQEERKNIEDEINYLKSILDFYVEFNDKISSLDQKGIELHINDILDKLNELTELLES
ncbi:hypothetical protein [Dyadobacter sp. CY343]|uniref:hypothetical protein n=1 Tax=Dyadobacter sp. CY343 TaxID=2907299 RepID=UPI001F3E30EC|nr:hypothetical protein [Dyadobacter sp. CY343]MCE7063058.1 hypothetical protein [Dyadobacter sp. CY343]